MRRIVIELYSHTDSDEIAEMIEAIRGIGIDDAFVEEKEESEVISNG